MLAQLQEIPEFSDVQKDELNWLIEKGEILNFSKGDDIFEPGDPIDKLIIFLEGKAILKAKQGNQFRVVGEMQKNSITGLLPYSRADVAGGYAQVIEPVKILALHKSNFREMIVSKETLTRALVHSMSTRIREFTKNAQLNDKMMALGKLSAGLAHELNNPSAAIVRSSQTLAKHLKLLPENFKSVIKIRVTDEQVDAVNNLLFGKIANGPQTLSMMERSEKEDELFDWLDQYELTDSEQVVENLVEFGFEESDLELVKNNVTEKDLPSIIRWIDQNLTTERLVKEIEEASSRINKLVSSVKSYTHMDQSPEKMATDIHIGMDNTLTMLNHKIKKSNINVIRNYQKDLPKPSILPSEINQVWTNLIDNAIDALEDSEKKEITIKTYQEDDFVLVTIEDSGSGIPEEIQDQVFDPFFTTKAIGKGTGLGMEVVNRIVKKQHHGSVTFTSEPGKTIFKVCIPIK